MCSKIVFVTNIPTPYRIPLFNELYNLCKQNNEELKFVFSSASYSFRKWNADTNELVAPHVFLTQNNSEQEHTTFAYPKLVRYILKEKPAIVVVPGFSKATLKLVLLKFFLRYKLIIWSGSTINPNRNESAIKMFYRKQLVRFANAFIVYGTKAKEYIESLNADSSKIVIAFNSIDTAIFNRPTMLSTTPSVKLLYVGNFTKGKRLDLLIASISELKKHTQNIQLTLIGDGPEKLVIESLITQHQLQAYVTILNYKQQNELIPYYHQSHIFLFPSQYDIWGLVVNEAMAAGLCVVASDKAGATSDLINNGQTGFCVDFSDTHAVAQLLLQLIQQPDKITTIGANAHKFINSNVTIKQSAQAFQQALHAQL